MNIRNHVTKNITLLRNIHVLVLRNMYNIIVLTLFGTSIKWNKDFKYSAVYSEKERDFFIEPELEDEAKRLMEDNFFSKDFESNRERIRLVYRDLKNYKLPATISIKYLQMDIHHTMETMMKKIQNRSEQNYTNTGRDILIGILYHQWTLYSLIMAKKSAFILRL